MIGYPNIRVNVEDIHERLQDHRWYWNLMKGSFSIMSRVISFQVDNTSSRLRKYVMSTIYHWPKVLGIVLVIVEVSIYERFSLSRAYLASPNFSVSNTKADRFLGR
jgi:hypothetical protein